jgi:endonuclease YncB( thermonuclease family)
MIEYWTYAAPLELECNLVRCKDGDTYVVESADTPFYPFRQLTVRLKGCDTPELDDPRREIANIGWAALDEMKKHVGKRIRLRSTRHDGYGRIEADVFLVQDHLEVKDHLCKLGLAKLWNGRGKSPWSISLPDSKSAALGSGFSES